MLTTISDWLVNLGVNQKNADITSYVILALAVLIICVAAKFFTKRIIFGLVSRFILSNKMKWDDVLVNKGVFRRLSHFVPIVIISLFSPFFGIYEGIIKKGVSVYFVVVFVLVLDAVIDSVDEIYRMKEISKTRPIKGLLQIAKITVFIIGGIVIVADLMGQSPLVLLSGIGAAAAVFSFIFKDSLMGLVAGIQLSANDMVRIGDWIEMPKYAADGSVIEISLNTVKVQNFDKTITTIPAYALVSDSFKNWRGMVNSGGRRIMRSVYIDVGSIAFCSGQMLERLSKSSLLKDYISSKQSEIERYNKSLNLDPSCTVNARRLTNIGMFRVYIQNYLKNHPGIHSEMIQMIRQLPPGEHGLPLQIYAFTNTTNWVEYENIQSDIFDHILSVAGQFGLKVFQNPSGNDFRRILSDAGDSKTEV